MSNKVIYSHLSVKKTPGHRVFLFGVKLSVQRFVIFNSVVTAVTKMNNLFASKSQNWCLPPPDSQSCSCGHLHPDGENHDVVWGAPDGRQPGVHEEEHGGGVRKANSGQAQPAQRRAVAAAPVDRRWVPRRQGSRATAPDGVDFYPSPHPIPPSAGGETVFQSAPLRR